MIISQGTKDFAQGLYERVFGYNPAQLLEEQKKKGALLAKERQKAEKEKLRAEEEKLKAEEERMKERKIRKVSRHLLSKFSVTRR